MFGRSKITISFLTVKLQVIEKLEKTVNDGNHYGALQMYKSYSVRYEATLF